MRAGGGWMKRTLPCCTSTWNSRRACPYSSSRSADAHQAFSSLALRQDSKRDEISWDVGPPPASQSWIAIYKSQKNKKNKIKIAVYVYVILFFTRNLLLLWCIGIMVYVSPEMGDTYGTGFGTSHAGLKPEPPVVALAISIISSRWFSIATAVIHLQLCIICLVSYEKVFNQ